MNKKSNNILKRMRVPLLVLALIVLLTTIFSQLTPKPELISKSNEKFNDNELTGWIYLGPNPYQLVYRTDTKRDMGNYVLKSAVKNLSDVELTKEENIDPGDVTGIAISPDNTKFIVTRVLGDETRRILIGVNKLKNETLSAPIELKEINLQDQYLLTYHIILSWVDNERILIKRINYDKQIKETYWVAPVSNISAMKAVVL